MYPYNFDKLKNGITVLKVPISGSESVVVNFFVKTGSRYEIAEQRGISHFLEHLLFKGTRKYPNAKLLSTTIESIGAEYNAATGKEYTVFYIKAASRHLPLIFDVLSDMLQAPKLDPREIEREKGVIVEEMNMYRDTPMRYIYDVFEEHLWPGSDLGAQIIGNEKTVTAIRREDLKKYIQERYVGKNLILAIAGKYNERQLDRLIGRYWAGKPAGAAVSFKSPLSRSNQRKVKIHFKKTQQAHLAWGFEAFSYSHPQVYVLEVLANLLGGGMSSRLFSEIRERRGLAYYVKMGAVHYQDTGSAVITAGLRLEKIEEAIKVIGSELNKLKLKQVGKEELKKAKENIKGRLTLSLEDSERRLEWYLEQIAFRKKVLTPQAVFRKIDAVTPRQIQGLARQLFGKDKMRLAVIGPYRGQERKFERLMR